MNIILWQHLWHQAWQVYGMVMSVSLVMLIYDMADTICIRIFLCMRIECEASHFADVSIYTAYAWDDNFIFHLKTVTLVPMEQELMSKCRLYAGPCCLRYPFLYNFAILHDSYDSESFISKSLIGLKELTGSLAQ